MSIRKDALEYAKAKLDYGEGAGLLRRKIGAKLSEKLKDENYRNEFEKELKDVDMSNLQKCVDREHTMKAVKNTALSGIKTGKKILAGLGITAVTMVPLYIKNREKVNNCVKKYLHNTKEEAKNGWRKIKGSIRNFTLRFKKKEEPIFYKNVEKLEDYRDRIDPSSINRT